MMEQKQRDDWKQWFRGHGIQAMQLAHNDPTRGLVVTNLSGHTQLYSWDVLSGELVQVTHRVEGVVVGFLSSWGREVYYLDDEGGNEIGHLIRVSVEGEGEQDLMPDFPPYSTLFYAESGSGNLFGCIAAVPDAGFHVYCVDLLPQRVIGPPRQLYQSTDLIEGLSISPDGGTIVIGSTERSPGSPRYSLLALDTQKGDVIGHLWDGPGSSIDPIAFSPLPDAPLLAATDRTGVKRPVLWSPRTGVRQDLEFRDIRGDVIPLDWSRDGRQLLLCQVYKAEHRLFLYDLESGRLIHLGLPGGAPSKRFGRIMACFGLRDQVLALWSDADHPSHVIATSCEGEREPRVLLSAGEVPAGRSLQCVTFPSLDGTPLQGWLGTPNGMGPFPTVVELHGGPNNVAANTFRPGSQAWLASGFAFLTVNYRGSTTFGRAFEQQIYGDVGHYEVEDVVAARNWLVQQGIAHPDQVCLTGRSYGGFLTLLALGKYPDAWMAGMAISAIVDWVTQYEDAAPTLRGYQVALLGGTPQEKPEVYRIGSPVHYVEQVQAPILIIHGMNDKRTPARPVRLYVQRLAEMGKRVEVKWFDAGHLGASAVTEEAIAHQEQMMRFASGIIAGRET